MYSTSYNTVYCIGIAKCRVRGEIHGSLLKGSLTPVLPESTALEGPMQTFCFLAENSAVHWHQCCQNLQPFRPNENVLFLAYNSTVLWHQCCQNLQPLRAQWKRFVSWQRILQFNDISVARIYSPLGPMKTFCFWLIILQFYDISVARIYSPWGPNENVLFLGREFCSSMTSVLPESTAL